jgi:hypothetical protein
MAPICSNGSEEKEKYDSLSRDIDRLGERLESKLKEEKKAIFRQLPDETMNEFLRAAGGLSHRIQYQVINPEQRTELHDKLYVTLYGEPGQNEN